LALGFEEFRRMTWGNYMRRCVGYQIKVINGLRNTRSILGAIAGKDPRTIYELPGDWDEAEKIKPKTQEELKEIARKFGVAAWVS
jgi:hypothetical protein